MGRVMNSVTVIRRRKELEPARQEKFGKLVEIFRAAIKEGFTGRIAIEIKEGLPVSVEAVRKIKL